MPTLCLDIGSGTQDVLYFDPSADPHNCPKFVLPAPARMVAARITRLAEAGRAIHLHGHNMGGGFGRAVHAAISSGVTVTAHPRAAKALGDNLSRVEATGVKLSETLPAGAVPVFLADYDPGFWQTLTAQAGLEPPDLVLAAVQDHGEHLDCGNREGRFRLWVKFLLQADGRPECLLYDTPPEELTRLAALQEQIGGGQVADTGAAAVLGALSMDEVTAESRERGICVVNVGNSHTIAYLVFRGRIYGVYEHHTGFLDGDKLSEQLNLFRSGNLTHEQVYEDRGHGCLTLELPAEAKGFPSTHVIGPRRTMLENRDCRFLSPHGDMMLAGCWGLLHGLALKRENTGAEA